ncbi:MAG: hypothetical protein FWH51_04965 [Dehalococcoidia bacterium]|nr:hypothetical protein [Dehalococcoidia bacterium]
MRRVHLVIIAVILLIILTVIALALNVFVFGQIKDISLVGARDVYVSSEKISLYITFGSSADTMSGYSYRIKDDIMYIKIKHVIVGIVNKPNVEIIGDFSTLQKIVLEDNDGKQKVIWEK